MISLILASWLLTSLNGNLFIVWTHGRHSLAWLMNLAPGSHGGRCLTERCHELPHIDPHSAGLNLHLGSQSTIVRRVRDGTRGSNVDHYLGMSPQLR